MVGRAVVHHDHVDGEIGFGLERAQTAQGEAGLVPENQNDRHTRMVGIGKTDTCIRGQKCFEVLVGAGADLLFQ